LPWQAAIAEMLASPVPVVDFDAWPLAEALDAAFAEVMSLPNLVQLFGQEATRNPVRPFADHFAQRTREVIERLPPRSNPFLRQILAGDFDPSFRYDWLQEAQVLPARPHWHCGKMKELLESMPAGSAALVHLSNILDWLSREDGQATLLAARRVLKPGGNVIIRQLNSSLDIPALEAGLLWDAALGRAMERRDRSYFYPQIHIGTRA
jgi:S-adenosylmethionine-diacylglycerol 3-amino-3-carboxypropyl transferase